jgi:large subunit ribosomal protein L44e
MVSFPKKMKTLCMKCKKHKPMTVSVYKAGKRSEYSQGQRRYNRKQQGFGGQTKPVFHKKAKTTKKIVLKLKCADCAQSRQIVLKRCKTFQLVTEQQRKNKPASQY